MPLHRRLPKRGFNNIFRLKLNEVNLGSVQAALDKGKLDQQRGGRFRGAGAMPAFCAGRGTVYGCSARAKSRRRSQFAVTAPPSSAMAAVEKAGGSVKILAPQKPAEDGGDKAA